MHHNLLAYDDHEIFDNVRDEFTYKMDKLRSVEKNIHFIHNLFDGEINVLELGSGNGKFLLGLERANLLNSGTAIEISNSRHSFAVEWARELKCTKTSYYNQDVLDTDLTEFGEQDLIYCVDAAFQFLDPVKSGSDREVLSNSYNALKRGGKIVLEVETHTDIFNSMLDGNFKTWQRLDDSDPWEYLLWDCNAVGINTIEINKIFIHRHHSPISKSSVTLRDYSRNELLCLLESVGFKNCKIYEDWDEFMVVGEK